MKAESGREAPSMTIRAATMATAITQNWVAMPTAVITLSSEKTASTSTICTRTPPKLLRPFPFGSCGSSPSSCWWISRVPL
jgi:hypothetical protein